jgi:hypothetical protein
MRTLLLHTGFVYSSRFYRGYIAKSLIEIYIPYQVTQWDLPQGISFDQWYTVKYAALKPNSDEIDCYYTFNDIGGISLVLPSRFSINSRQS